MISLSEQASSDWIDDFESSQVRRFKYNHETRVLTVQFVSTGSVYEYIDVPVEIYEQFKAAESKGSYFIRNIKRGPYRYQRIS